MTPDEMRRAISGAATGKIIESLEWDTVGGYWVMRFTDGSETCWSLNMAELPPARPRGGAAIEDLVHNVLGVPDPR